MDTDTDHQIEYAAKVVAKTRYNVAVLLSLIERGNLIQEDSRELIAAYRAIRHTHTHTHANKGPPLMALSPQLVVGVSNLPQVFSHVG